MENTIHGSMVILYVNDQSRSRDFYQILLGHEPTLDVEGMTEFALDGNSKLGLMPEGDIVKILEGKVSHPAKAGTGPRAEIYLYVDDTDAYLNRLERAGGTTVCGTSLRSWGDMTAYGLDPDGHVIAFARKTS